MSDEPDTPTHDADVTVDTYVQVGPYPDVHGHGPVSLVGTELVVCLDCGYLTDDIRMLAHADCNRSNNSIAQTWRERLASDELDDDQHLPDASNANQYPIE